MATEIADIYGYRVAGGTVTGVASQPILAVPESATLVFDYAGTWKPNTTLNPLINADIALRRGVYVLTDPTGAWSVTLPEVAESQPSSPEPKWSLLFPDGQVLTGVVPAGPGPYTVYDLVLTYGWVWATRVYVAPVTAGALARGSVTFSGASATASVLFASAFASSAYVIKWSSSIDTNTAEPMLVSWANKTTTGFDLVAKDAAYVGTVDWEASL